MAGDWRSVDADAANAGGRMGLGGEAAGVGAGVADDGIGVLGRRAAAGAPRTASDDRATRVGAAVAIAAAAAGRTGVGGGAARFVGGAAGGGIGGRVRAAESVWQTGVVGTAERVGAVAVPMVD